MCGQPAAWVKGAAWWSVKSRPSAPTNTMCASVSGKCPLIQTQWPDVQTICVCLNESKSYDIDQLLGYLGHSTGTSPPAVTTQTVPFPVFAAQQ